MLRNKQQTGNAHPTHQPIFFQYMTWKVILKALLSKAFKITHFSVLARLRRAGEIVLLANRACVG